jgi:hypothetical protein
MLPSKRLQNSLLLILCVLIVFFGVLLFIYQKQKGKAVPYSEIESASENISLVIKDEAKWREFLTGMCGCEYGNFGIYEALDPHTLIQAKRIHVVITDFTLKNSHLMRNSDGGGEQTLYTYDIVYDTAVSEALVFLNFPNKKDAETINTAIVLTIYSLFNGQPYSSYDEKVASYNSLDKVGLEYEER